VSSLIQEIKSKLAIANKQKLSFFSEGKYIDVETGVSISNKEARKSIIINLTFLSQKPYNVSRSKLFTKYVYKTKKGLYIGSSTLNIQFLLEILKDNFNKNAFIFKSSNKVIVVFILGKKIKIINNQKDNFIEEKALFFQGVEPKEISYEKILNKIKPSNKKKIIIISLFFIIGLYFISNNLSSNSDDNINLLYQQMQHNNKVTKKDKSKKKKEFNILRKKLTKSEEEIAFTHYFLNSLFNIQDLSKDSVYIKSINFDGGITLNSFIPELGFNRRGNIYNKNILIKPNNVELHLTYLKTKYINYQKCVNLILNYTTNIFFMSQNGDKITYQFKKSLTPEKFTNLLNSLRKCPVSITGEAHIDIKNIKVNPNFLVNLYTKKENRINGK
jgi:hypothetical protein